MLTREQIEFYNEKGYVGVESVLSADEVAELGRVTDEFVEKSRTVTENDEVFDLEPAHTSESPKLRRLKNPTAQHPVYERTWRDDRILDMVAQLIGPAFRSNGTKLNVKSGEAGSPVEWHQDWAFYPHSNDDILAVGVAIDDMTRENGCLMIMPGSHKGKIYNHHQDGCFIGAVTEEDYDDSEAELVELKAGGISIHHVRALHGSLPNTTKNPRRLLLLQYCAADAWPYCQPVTDWDTFNSTLVRGEPTCEPRVEKVPIRIPLPPSKNGGGSIYTLQSRLARSTFKKARAAG